MIKTLDEKLNIRALVLDNNPNTYYLSYQGDTKCVIDTKQVENDILIIPEPQGECTVEELTTIINCFSKFIFTKYSNINGILFKTDPNDLLERIGFKLVSEDSEYLYKENKQNNKVR